MPACPVCGLENPDGFRCILETDQVDVAEAKLREAVREVAEEPRWASRACGRSSA